MFPGDHYLKALFFFAACGCDSSGSIGINCDDSSGQCSCHPDVLGRTCDQCQVSFQSRTIVLNVLVFMSIFRSKYMIVFCLCQENHWGHSTGEGCTACDCDLTGAEDAQCDLETGRCRCKPGIGGLKCDQCQFGYYGFSEDGCKGKHDVHMKLSFHTQFANSSYSG